MDKDLMGGGIFCVRAELSVILVDHHGAAKDEAEMKLSRNIVVAVGAGMACLTIAPTIAFAASGNYGTSVESRTQFYYTGTVGIDTSIHAAGNKHTLEGHQKYQQADGSRPKTGSTGYYDHAATAHNTITYRDTLSWNAPKTQWNYGFTWAPWGAW